MATRSTLRLGASDQGSNHDVSDWQKLIGIKPADGKYGPASVQATRDWQKSHKLVADGVVGPNSWAVVSGGEAPAPQKNSSAPADQSAYAVAKRAAPSMPEAERQYALAVARGEGFYGLGWPQGAGAGSNNWGAVQGVGSAGSFDHVDHHADGTPYTGKFKAYKTREEGFLDMARILLKPNVQAALAKGNLHDAVFAQHANGYFELDPAKYLAAVSRNYDQLAVNVSGWKKLLSDLGPGVSRGLRVGAYVLAVAAITVGSFFLVRHLRKARARA